MKKILGILSIFLVALIAVSFAGCIDDSGNVTNNTTNNTTNNSTGINPPLEFEFDESMVIADPMPEGFEHIATQSVMANEEVSGITDELPGTAGYYAYDGSNVYLTVYECDDADAAQGYINQMKQETARLQGEVSSVTVNEHDAALLKTKSVIGTEISIIAWTRGNLLVVVDGPAGYDAIKTLADASGL